MRAESSGPSAWPLFAIRLALDDVLLRPVSERDLDTLSTMLPSDVEHDPSWEMLEGLDLSANLRRLFMQSYWRSWGCWSVNEWVLHFAVLHRGRLVGVQTLEGSEFPELRTVDSSSWLVKDARNQGVGRAMRTAMLSFAFGKLGAEAAVTSAREENSPSLGVSRALGYEDNGVSRSRSPSGPCTLRHMILRRAGWLSSGFGATVRVSGVEGCGPWFGVEIGED